VCSVEGCGCGGGSLSSAANELGGVRHKRHRGAMAEAPERENHTNPQRQNASPRTYSPQTGDARRHRRPSILGRGQQNSTRPQARHNQTTSHVTTPTTATTSTSTSTKIQLLPHTGRVRRQYQAQAQARGSKARDSKARDSKARRGG